MNLPRPFRKNTASVLLVVGGLLLGLTVLADGPPGPSLLLPYQGTLQFNGASVEDSLDVNFELFNAESGGSSLWSNTRTVDPDGGSFGVVLGELLALPDSVRTTNTLWLQISIDGNTLGTRQALFAAFQAVTSNGSVNADYADNAGYAVTADGNGTGTFSIAKNGTLSKIAFAAQTNDPGEIVHYEDNNAGQLWLSPSDDWDSSATNDLIIFGQQDGNHRRFSVDGAGNGWFDADLDVDGTVNAATLSASSLVTAPNISATSNIGANGYVRAGNLKLEGENVSLSSNDWTNLSIGGYRGAGFLFINSSNNDRPAATFNFADDSSNDGGTVNRTASHAGYNSTCSLEARWPGNSWIQIRKSCSGTTYNGTYRVGMMSLD